MSTDHVTVCSEFFRWILREKSDFIEPIGFKELSSEYTTDEILKSHLWNSYSKIRNRMHKLEGFTVFQKIHMLFLIDKSPCKPFQTQMREAGEYQLNRLNQIQWFRSTDGSFKLERTTLETMSTNCLTAFSEFFRWILREKPDNVEPFAFGELLRKYTADRKLHSKLMSLSSYMLSKMDKLEGFTVLQKIQILFLIKKSPCKPFQIQMNDAGDYQLNSLQQIQWFRSKDGTFKLESVISILAKGNTIEQFTLYQNIHIFFLASRPISQDFEEKIKNAGNYTLDKKRRIIHFRSADGSFERKDIWRNHELQEGEEDREEEMDYEMPDDSEQSNIRQDLEHEELDPEPMEGMESDPGNESTIQRDQGRSQRDFELEDFEPEHREPTTQFETRQENGQVYLAPELISKEPLEPVQNGPDVIPTFVKLAEPKDPVVKQEPPEDLNEIIVKEEVEEQEAKPILIEPPSAIHLLTLIRNLIWTINSPSLNDLLRKVEVKMAKPGIEDIKIPFIDIEAAALHGLGNLFKSASDMISPDSEPVELSQILYLFNLMLSMIELPPNSSVFTKIEEFIRGAGDKVVSMEKVEFAIGCMVQPATLN